MEKDNDITICQHDIIKFFHVAVFFLSSLITSPSFMSTLWLVLELWQFFIYKGLTRNLEIWNTHVWVLPNIWRLDQVSDTKFGKNVLKCYWIQSDARFAHGSDRPGKHGKLRELANTPEILRKTWKTQVILFELNYFDCVQLVSHALVLLFDHSVVFLSDSR